MSTPKSRKSRTKEEIQDEFDNVVDAVHSMPGLSPKELQAKQQREKDTMAKVATLSPEAVSEKVNKARFEIDRIIGSVNELLIDRTNELRAVSDAIEIQRDELIRLHGVDTVAAALDVLIAEHTAKSDEFQKLTRETQQRWIEEQQLHAKQLQEQYSELEKKRQREEADYQYSTSQRHKKVEDEFAEKMRITQAQERDHHEMLTKSWTEREATLKAREQELLDFKAKVEQFPTQLDAEVKRQVAIVTNSLTRDHKHELELLKRDTSSAAQLAAEQIKQLQVANQALTAQAEVLQTKLAEAYAKNTELSGKALEAASGRQALNELRDLQLTQAQNGPAKRS
jgi:hypothetical protein